MSFRWSELQSSPATPDRRSNSFGFSADHPSTTPAGPPPPSSVASLTPAGEPSPSYLQSSIGAMSSHSAASNKPKAPNFGKPSMRSPQHNPKGGNEPLGRSIRGSIRQPSRLSKEYHGEDEEDEENVEEQDKEQGNEDAHNHRATGSGTFTMNLDDTTEGDDPEPDTSEDMDDGESEGDDYEDEYEEEEEEEDEEEDEEGDEDEEEDDQDDGEGGSDLDDDERESDVEITMEDAPADDIDEDLIREIAETGAFRDSEGIDCNNTDLMIFTTPAANERMMKDANDLYRTSTMLSAMPQKNNLKYAMLAKDLYSNLSFATVSEPDNLLIQTEDIMNRLYDEGIGAEDDIEKLDSTLTRVCDELLSDVWASHTENLPKDDTEHSAKVGPGPQAPAFEKAMYLANLILRIHHIPPIQDEFRFLRYPVLPEVLFRWQEDEHNLDANQVDIILLHRPSPASHALFWQAVLSTLVRGNLKGTIRLLRNAAWEYVRGAPGGTPTYTGQALANIRRAVEDLCQVMERCPAVSDRSWDIRSSDWTLFRLKAQAARESLTSFAEGKDRSLAASNRFNGPPNIFQSSESSLTGLARKAESQIPWNIYENLQSLYALIVGEPEAILTAAQDWCEATIGLFGWWDEGHNKRNQGLAHSRSIHSTYQAEDDEALFDRLASSLHMATRSDFHFISSDPVEVGIASVFEGNVGGVIGFLRLWSLPIAATVAEIASLGRWLPPPEPQNLMNMDEFDPTDLEVLGINPTIGPNDKDGIKDSTLIHYARSLKDRKDIVGSTSRGNVSRDGWEMAVQIVGRMDSHERSERIVEELLQGVLHTIDEGSRSTVDKLGRLLNDLGMVDFAEETAENFGDILAKDTFRFGEALWYYALAHRPNKVRDVLNTLMSISLVESTVYPPDGELDKTLRGLLKERTTTLETLAKQDLEAAELLGKMLSGYATLRQFYECRDGNEKTRQKPRLHRRQAASALTAVIASADDNIRGGLYDDSRDAVVSEDFLLALLGEFSVFVGQSPPVVTLEQIDILLKAIEDIQTVGSRVYEAADEFFKLVLTSGHGKGSTPASLLGQSTPSLGGSFVMTGSSIIASQLHKSVSSSGMLKGNVKRSWDWRTTVFAASGSEDVLKQLRLGLTKDLADLWLEQADNVIM
ncbi:hypothetical protein GGR50DRAFT_340883 [Xylaria sp. CBS 124048]|nr:hypothetical protein GGR50DRAFT_340883 [Xylaria sp. CBS 124048]